MLLAQEDSTGQRITLIVIGLLLAALMLAILTAWYYRVTDPGPRQGRRPNVGNSRAGGSNGGGQAGRGPEPSSGPGWRKRLSSMSVPSSGPTSAKSAQKPAKAGSAKQQPAQQQPARRQQSAHQPEQQNAQQQPSVPETVSLEGGYYLDLTDAPRSSEPVTNVGSLNSLDLRQPAPLVDPATQVRVPATPNVPETHIAREPNSGDQPVASDKGLSFDDWLAEVEASEGK